MASSSHNNLEELSDQYFDQYFDQYCDQYFDQTLANLTVGHEEEPSKQRKKRAYIERNREEGHIRLWNDYFSETPTYTENLF